MWSAVSDHVTEFASICGVPYTALPIATVGLYATVVSLCFTHVCLCVCVQVMSVTQGVPMLMRRKEAKSYGTKVRADQKLLIYNICSGISRALAICTLGMTIVHGFWPESEKF